MIDFDITDHLGRRHRRFIVNGKMYSALPGAVTHVPVHPLAGARLLRALATVPAWLWLLPLAFVLLMAIAGAVRT